MKLTKLTPTDLTHMLREQLATANAKDLSTRHLTGLLRTIRAELNTRAMDGDIPAAFALELSPETIWSGEDDHPAW